MPAAYVLIGIFQIKVAEIAVANMGKTVRP